MRRFKGHKAASAEGSFELQACYLKSHKQTARLAQFRQVRIQLYIKDTGTGGFCQKNTISHETDKVPSSTWNNIHARLRP
ncbi:uncharacterized [Tachysurus ichikawai]